MTNSFIYKIVFICLTIMVWTSCQQQKVETLNVNSKTSNVNSNSKNSERDKKDDVLRKAELKKWDKEWIEKLSKDFKVLFLENEQFSNDSLEIRFWYTS